MAKRKASSASSSKSAKNSKKSNEKVVEESPVPIKDEIMEEVMVVDSPDELTEELDEVKEEGVVEEWAPRPKSRSKNKKTAGKDGGDEDCLFTSSEVAHQEAVRKWPHRYVDAKATTNAGVQRTANINDDEDEPLLARRHFTQAKVDGQIFNLFDDAHVMADPGEDDYICKIIEFFEATDGSQHFTAQWFYRAKDTVIGETCGKELIDSKCIFFSEVKNDNPLNCLVKKIKIEKVSSQADSDYINKVKDTCDYYYQMMYLLPYTSFVNLPDDELTQGNEPKVSASTDSDISVERLETSPAVAKTDLVLMDLYSGCGGMSTGLCLGGSRGGVRVTTKWALDFNEHACKSLKLNHPETEVRNEPAEDFLALLKEWYQLCASYSLVGNSSVEKQVETPPNEDGEVTGGEENEDEDDDDTGDDGEVYEVEEILGICCGDPKESNESGLHFKIKWKGYGPEYDTWEPRECLSGCPEKLKDFVVQGFKSKLLPLPGDVDVICGGPPCQGISGYNRFRNAEEPLKDEKNKQLLVYMDIVSFLKPKYVLMENVVDILKFSGGFLGKYAIGKIVQMGYQARMGMMAAGSYGLPQFRMRFFLWGALPTEALPAFALPTHNVVNRGVVPTKFEANVVAYEEGRAPELKKALYLGDALSDLPAVENDESRDIMPYKGEPKTDFQRFIRLKKEVMLGLPVSNSEVLHEELYDHRPLHLNDDDYQRVCQIPMRKGANFRDLRGVIVGSDNKVAFDPNVERVYLASKKPLVPDYAMTFVKGTSTKPFGRLWWDETVPTVMTRAEPHNHALLHPAQNRVLTIRENARLQGFPDYYQLTGPIKERYIQVGNAVAGPVGRALGYCLAMAYKGDVGTQPLLELPKIFSEYLEPVSAAESS